MIHIIRNKATQEQIDQMLEELDPIIKLAVDIGRGILAGGGQMYADCEAVLRETGSHQEDIWGANWIPVTQIIEFEALINIRPKQQNMTMAIQDAVIKSKVENISRKLLEGG
ncbi:hypothetical protein A2V82_16615 [candidate division KSB1 bacterium RBG_16_48_16]|nr:MAG: hypothetical protein A2V82_16615 [candidate division KSB1 bacterium RBG_16_48_16]